MYRVILVLAMSGLLLGCGGENDLSATNDSLATKTTTRPHLEEIDESKNLIVVASEGKMVLYDLESLASKPVYEFTNNLPARQSISTFQVSPKNNFVVWYEPTHGIHSLDLRSSRVETVFKPSEWFNTNPYIHMDKTDELISFIDDGGRKLYEIDLQTKKISNSEVPFPYGTIFINSPDMQKRVFVSGFGQNQVNPRYLLVDAGKTQEFETQTELSDRDKIAWNSNSDGIFVIENGNEIVQYYLDSIEDGEVFYELNDDERAVNLTVLQDKLWVQTADGSWYVIDILDSKLQSSVASNVFNSLNFPQLIPWSSNNVLVEETLTQFDEEFKRLWISDLLGVKQVLVPEYGRVKKLENRITPATTLNDPLDS